MRWIAPLVLALLAGHWPQRLSQLHDRAITTTFGALDSTVDEAARVDHRYAAIVAAAPAQFDIDRASAAARAKSAAVMRARPRSLRALTDHTYDLLSAGENGAVLKLTEDALARIEAAGPYAPPFDDVAEFRPWIMNNRAIALSRLGRRDEALAQLERARGFDEDGGSNVSQTINLAGEYLDGGRAREALALVGQLDWARGGMSPYGKMQMQGVRHGALQVLGDHVEAARALQYLRDHQLDDVRAYQRALVRANDADAAAALLMSRLADVAQRNDALLDVQAAISKAGRREKFNIVL